MPLHLVVPVGDDSAIHTIDPTMLIENQGKVGIVKKNVKQMAVKFDSGSSKNLSSSLSANTAAASTESSGVVSGSADRTVVEGATEEVSLKSETDALTSTASEDA